MNEIWIAIIFFALGVIYKALLEIYDKKKKELMNNGKR
jgi:hypothetical protein